MTSMIAQAGALLAHQGGWDEVLLIGGPILAIVGLLILAKRRVDRLAADADAAADDQDRTDDPAGAGPTNAGAGTEHPR